MSLITIQSFNTNPMQAAIKEVFACIEELQVETIIQLNDNLYSVMYTALTELEERDFCFIINTAIKRNNDLAVIEIALPVENEIWDRSYQTELDKLLII